MRVTLDISPLAFDPIRGDEGSFREGIKGRFPSEPGRAEEKVHAYFDCLGDPKMVLRIGDRNYSFTMRAVAAAVRDAERATGRDVLPAAFLT